MAMIGENQVRNYYVVETATNSTLSDVRTGTILNSAIVNYDGTAASAGNEFLLAILNNRNEMTISDVINPNRIMYAKSLDFEPRIEQLHTITNIVAEANKLYQVSVIIKGYGSLSTENEYLKEAFYKSKTGDDAENIVDGLVKSLARNFSREQPASAGTFTYTLKGGGTVVLPDNLYFSFIKSFSDGVAETSTFTVTAAPTSEGLVTVTLDGEDYDLPVSIGTADNAALELAEGIGGVEGFTATAAGNVVTVVAAINGPKGDAAFAAGDVSGIAVTVATTQQGADGTSANAELSIIEKEDYLETYYVTGKKDRLTITYTVDAFFPELPTINANQGFPGIGTGYQVRNAEYYFQGNRADSFRGAGYPHNFEQVYDSKLDGNYYQIELGYYDEGRDDPMKSKKQLTIAVESKAAANALITQLNTALTGTVFSLSTFA